MHRCFVPTDQLTPPNFTLTGEVAHHLVRSLRVRPGEELLLLDEGAQQPSCHVRVVSTGRETLDCLLLATHPLPPEPTPRIDLAQALSRDGIDDTLRIATSFGVTSITPLITERTVSAGDPERYTTRLKRWRSIVRDEAELSGRFRPAEVESVQYLTAWLSSVEDPSHVFVCDIDLTRPPLAHAVSGMVHITLVVGPEGGWGKTEYELFVERGFPVVQFGPYTIRSQYAGGIAVALTRAAVGFSELVP